MLYKLNAIGAGFFFVVVCVFISQNPKKKMFQEKIK